MEAARSSGGLGLVVGFRAEAPVAHPIGAVAIAGGTAVGAASAAKRLIGHHIRALISFGLAGGLDPALLPGAIVIPRAVQTDGERFCVDRDLLQELNGPTVELVLGNGQVAVSDEGKHQLRQQTGASAIDTESGAVARVARQHGLPFAVLRAVCDPAERTLPPAALIALDQAGAIRFLRVLASVAAAPSQIPALIQLASDAAIARRALIRHVAALKQRLPA